MKPDKNSYGVNQEIAEALAVGAAKKVADRPWEGICKDVPNTDPDEKSPCKRCRAAISNIATWDKTPSKRERDVIAAMKNMLGDQYPTFARAYAAAVVKLERAFTHVPDEPPATPPPKKEPAKKPRAKRDPNIKIRLPERILKMEDPDLVKVPLIDDPVPIEDAVLTADEKEIIRLTENELAVGNPIQKIYGLVSDILTANDMTDPDNPRLLITLAYLPASSSSRLRDYIAELHGESLPIADQMKGMADEFAIVGKKIPRSLIDEKLAQTPPWDIVKVVFAPLAVGIIVGNNNLIKNALFEEALIVLVGAGFPELVGITCRLYAQRYKEKPEKIVNFSVALIDKFGIDRRQYDHLEDILDEAEARMREELDVPEEAKELIEYLQHALIEED